MNRKLTLRLLEKCGYRADAVEHGGEALERMSDTVYDLILMDCRMPVKDGYETTREIRSHEKSRERIPIIAMTAMAMKGDKERCLEAGMDDYLAKPIRIDELVTVMQSWLSGNNEKKGTSALERETQP